MARVFLRDTLVFGLALCAVSAFGQSSKLPSFEVASIKPFERGDQPGHGMTSVSGPNVTMTGYTLRGLILYAYDMRGYQISGGPSWMNSDEFKILAKVEGDAKPETAEVRKMVQSLLAERFGVKLRRESKEARVYLLMPAKTGTKLTASNAQRPNMGMSVGHLMMTKATLTQMAALLSSVLSRPVLDRTGIAGEYDFTLDSSDISMGRTIQEAPQEAPSGPSIFTAIQEQLGLKLEASKGEIETLVIEQATKPVAN